METRQEFNPTRLASRKCGLHIEKGVGSVISEHGELFLPLQIAAPDFQRMNYSQELLLGGCVILLSWQQLPAFKSNRPAILLKNCPKAKAGGITNDLKGDPL